MTRLIFLVKKSLIKDKLPILNTSNVIYKFVSLYKKTYEGITRYNLIKGINQHLPQTLLNKIKLFNKEK